VIVDGKEFFLQLCNIIKIKFIEIIIILSIKVFMESHFVLEQNRS